MISDMASDTLSQEAINLLAMLIPLLLQLAGMTFAVLVDSYISRQHKRVMLAVAALVFSLIAQNYVENLLVTEGGRSRFPRGSSRTASRFPSRTTGRDLTRKRSRMTGIPMSACQTCGNALCRSAGERS